MQKERWKKISRIFDVALTLPKEHRSTYIRELCRNEPELRQEIDQLLDSLTESEGLLEEHFEKHDILIDRFATHLDEFSPQTDDHLKGHTIGRWKLTELLGQGGMGSVYRAERTDPDIHQTGALKIMHRNLKTPQNIGRFRLEQQILASLRHPNISSLIEGGISEEGLPWMVMEYVEGQPLLKYCNTHRLSIKKRLDLFATICEAVEYAHRNLIVHRDLKPENIFVTNEGHIKILDFGIAKLLDPNLYDIPTAHTRQGMQLVSLEYAAPEQVSEKKITTSTDIYSLGILLYELLAGCHPFNFDGKNYGEIIRIIREAEPQPPSRKLRKHTGQDRPRKIAVSRSVKLSHLIRNLKGDLDAIILKAIRKDPDTRYNSVNQFKDDISSFLKNQPVSARQKVIHYRAKKFWQRHQKGVLAAASFVLVVASLISFYTAKLADERNTARLEAETAEQVSSFLMSLFEASQPDNARGNTITAQMLLKKGVERAETLENQPEIQARMFDEIGRAYRTMGRYQEAEPLIRRALNIRLDIYGEYHPKVAGSLNHLGLLQKELGDYASAESSYNQALSIQQRVLKKNHPETAETLNNLGVLYRVNGEYDKAEKCLKEALAIWEKLYGFNHPEVANTLQNLGALFMVQERYTEAEELLREALDTDKELYGSQHPRVAKIQFNLAQILKEQEQYDNAESLYRQTLAVQRDLYDTDNTEIAQTLNNLAVLLTEKKKFDEAESLLKEATEIRLQVLGDDHKEYVASLHNLAFFLQNKGDYEAADSLYRITLDKWRKLMGPNHPNVAVTLNNLASVQKALNQNDLAEQNYLNALRVRRSALGNDHPTVKRSIKRLVELYKSWNRPALAAAYQDTLSALGK